MNEIRTNNACFGRVINFWSYYETMRFSTILDYHVHSGLGCSIPNCASNKERGLLIIETTITAFLALINVGLLIIEVLGWIVGL